MTILVPWQRLRIGRNASLGGLNRLPIDRLSSRLVLRVRRETTDGLVVFPSASKLLARISLRAGTDDFVTTGRPEGGVRPSYRGGEIDQYIASWGLPFGFFDQRGPMRRLGEQRQGLDVSVDFELDGDPIDTEWQLELLTAAAPNETFHNSVALDAVTDKGEVGGGSVIDLTHTSTGTNRGMFMAVGNSGGIPRTTNAIEYNNVAQTEIWDETQNNVGNSGWYGVNQPTGAQLVEADFNVGSPDESVLVVASMTDVHQTTAINADTSANHTHKLGSGNTSMTKTAPGSITSDDMVWCFTYIAHSADPAISQGADQTERSTEKPVSGVHGASANQPGASGGVMSVTMAGSAFGAIHGAVAFKTATVSAGSQLLPRPMMSLVAVDRMGNY